MGHVILSSKEGGAVVLQNVITFTEYQEYQTISQENHKENQNRLENKSVFYC